MHDGTNNNAFSRKLASEINPLISPCNTAETIERVSNVLEDVGLAVSIEAKHGDPVLTDNFHRLAAVLAAALRYEEKALPRNR